MPSQTSSPAPPTPKPTPSAPCGTRTPAHAHYYPSMNLITSSCASPSLVTRTPVPFHAAKWLRSQSKDGDAYMYTYQVHVLYADQSGYNWKEVTWLEAEQPGENVVENGRVMLNQLYERYLGDKVHSNMKTSPYLTATAEPEITTTRIRKSS
ncbi:hypothetical protein BDP27DRAFT_1370775 [Rhodocollybia butyracea]|uniref:Uncharacterized protein n=1 Tax=Rhodocollybia butyracea TaxID=206335 RepID=A0A9P5PDI7_9AGAR|nr:hypothetical protein BDP27DRAFT_1370775 [Rhodocollybia butyracea]